MVHGIGCAEVNGGSGLLMVGRMHSATHSLVDGVLLAVALQAVSQHMRVFLVGLVGQACHLVGIGVRLA